jgi:phosphohistidine phosphatase
VSRLYLLRHAKAGWAQPGVRDFDRPLDASGLADAEAMGALMRTGNYIPDLTLCSNATRARQTLEGLAPQGLALEGLALEGLALEGLALEGLALKRVALEGQAGHADPGRVLFYDTLYSGDAADYLALIRCNGASGSLLVIGHNPMMEDLAMAVSGEGDETARAMLIHGFPTSGLAVVRFRGNLADAEPGAGYLEAFLTPADR